MAEGLLVREQIDDGERLIRALADDGFDVGVAFWAQQEEDNLVFLFIASPMVEAKGPAAAYRVVNAKIRAMPSPFWVDSFDVKLIGPSDPIAREAIRLRGNGNMATRLGGRQFGGLAITSGYIYPASTAAVAKA